MKCRVLAAAVMAGCATCERHPIACTAAVAIIGASVALSLRHSNGRTLPRWESGCIGYYEEQAATDCR